MTINYHGSIPAPSVSREVADRLWRLRWDRGYFARREIEAELGLRSPRGRWECPGQFGADGKWRACCGAAA